MALSQEDLIKEIKEMSVLDLNKLVKALEEEFGVSAAAATAVAAAPGAAAGDAPAAEEKDSFTVTLKEIGDNKINTIKTVREITGLGLKEAKTLVESAPTAIKEDISKEEAEGIKKTIDDAGAKAEIS